MANFHTLPHELQVQILVYLPPTYIFALRRLCRSWNAILSSPETERAINQSLFFSSTAPTLRSRLKRRTRLVNATYKQLESLEADAWKSYSDGYLVDIGQNLILGIWNCRREGFGREARVDVREVVWMYESALAGQVKLRELCFKFVEVGAGIVVVVVEACGLGESPGAARDTVGESAAGLRVPGGLGDICSNSQVLLVFELSTGKLMHYIPQGLPARVISAHMTSTILLVTTLAGSAAGDQEVHSLSTYSLATGHHLQTTLFTPLPLPPTRTPPSPRCTTALDTLDHFYTLTLPVDSDRSILTIHSVHTGAALTTIPLGIHTPTYSAVVFSDALTNQIHIYEQTAKVVEPAFAYYTSSQIQHTSFPAAQPRHRRCGTVRGFTGYGSPTVDPTARWGFIISREYECITATLAWNLSGHNSIVKTVLPRETAKVVGLRDHSPPAPTKHKRMQKIRDVWKSLRSSKASRSPPEVAPVKPVYVYPREPPLPLGMTSAHIATWHIMGGLHEAEFVGGDDCVWVLSVLKVERTSRDRESLARRTVLVSWDEGVDILLPTRRELEEVKDVLRWDKADQDWRQV